MARTRWYRQHPRSLATAYAVWKAGNPRGAVEIAWEAARVPSWKRAVLRCIASKEGGGRADVWYGHSRGWQGGRFVGTDRVNGWFQIRPYHAPTGDRLVTYRTYLYTSDPVWSALWSARANIPQAFAAQRGRCF